MMRWWYYVTRKRGGDRMEDFKINLKAARINAGLSMKDAAKRMHIGYQMLSNYERGANLPSEAQKLLFAKVYGIPDDMLDVETRDSIAE